MKEFTYKSAEELEAMSAEEQTKYVADMKAYEKAQREIEIKEATKGLVEGQVKLENQVKEVAETLSTIEETMKSGLTPELKGFLHNVVKENYETLVDAVKNKKEVVFEVSKVAAMHMTNNGTVSNISGLTYPTNDNFTVDSNIALIRVPENFILSVIPNRIKSKVPAQVIKRQQLATEGAAVLTAEGAVKPLMQYKFQNTATTRQKYTGRIEYTEEFAMDFEDLLAEIVRLFERDVLTDWQDGLFEIIDTNATAYVGSVLDGTLVNPDNALAVVAAGLQVESLNYGNDLTVIMNPQDVAAGYYTQDNNGNFALKPYIDANGRTIGAGYRLFTSNRVTAGTAYIGDFSIYNEIHSGFIIRTGQYNAQFIENEYTIIGEVFSILNAAPIDYKGIVKINLETVKAALKK